MPDPCRLALAVGVTKFADPDEIRGGFTDSVLEVSPEYAEDDGGVLEAPAEVVQVKSPAEVPSTDVAILEVEIEWLRIVMIIVSSGVDD